jgi:hypothetical protein
LACGSTEVGLHLFPAVLHNSLFSPEDRPGVSCNSVSSEGRRGAFRWTSHYSAGPVPFPLVYFGYPFFIGRQSNVLNFIPELDATWKVVYRGSEVLSWKTRRGGSTVNVVQVPLPFGK